MALVHDMPELAKRVSYSTFGARRSASSSRRCWMRSTVRARVTVVLDSGADLVEQLTARELTVLRYLGSRLTVNEIAAECYVSPNTLKTHVKAVYRKLDVSSRREAVDEGRRLQLLSTRFRGQASRRGRPLRRRHGAATRDGVSNARRHAPPPVGASRDCRRARRAAARCRLWRRLLHRRPHRCCRCTGIDRRRRLRRPDAGRRRAPMCGTRATSNSAPATRPRCPSTTRTSTPRTPCRCWSTCPIPRARSARCFGC